jgi:hypothetical protein
MNFFLKRPRNELLKKRPIHLIPNQKNKFKIKKIKLN